MNNSKRLPPPQNTEAEQSLIASILQKKSISERVINSVSINDFYNTANREIYKACLRLSEASVPVDVVTIADLLTKHSKMEVAGGEAHLKVLAALAPSSTITNAHVYAEMVHEAAVRRKLVAVGGIIEEIGWTGAGDIDEILSQAGAQIDQISGSLTRNEFIRYSDALSQLMYEIGKAKIEGKAVTGALSGFSDLDKVTGGFREGTLTILAARPSMGKSCLAQNFSENVSDRGGTALFYSLEMSQREITARGVARAAQVSLDHLMLRNISDEEEEKVKKAASKLMQRSLYVYPTSNLTPTQLRASLRTQVKTKKPALVVVDYLQLMQSGYRVENRNLEVAAITREMKSMALELEVPIVALSQLNRGLENRSDKRPTLGDLRDSGAIEQDADLVLFLYRDDQYNEDSQNQGIAEVIVAKNRNGPANRTVRLTFSGRFQTFNSLAKEGLPGA
jgi:replicative DNA helicase